MTFSCTNKECTGDLITEDYYPANEVCVCTVCGKKVEINYYECYDEETNETDDFWDFTDIK